MTSLVDSARKRVPAEGLPRARRLRRHNDFVGVERGGRRAHGSFITVVARLGRDRVGFTVSKKVSLRAVDRNRIRRLLREIVRTQPSLVRGMDVVLIANPKALGVDLVGLRADVVAAFLALGDLHATKKPSGPRAR